MENIELLRGRLRSVGLKATPQRISILSCVAASQAPVTAEEIFRRCPVGELNLSTVYRTLAALCRKGIYKSFAWQNGYYCINHCCRFCTCNCNYFIYHFKNDC